MNESPSHEFTKDRPIDQVLIHGLLNSYCALLDLGRYSDVATLFTPDGELDLTGTPSVGHQAIEDLLRSRGNARSWHLCGSIHADFESEGEAIVFSHVAVYRGPRSDTQAALPMAPPVALASYEDRVVLNDGRWRIASRVVRAFMK